MNLKVWNNQYYNVESDSIRCAADRDGCSVFEVDGRIGPLKILAPSEAEARFQYTLEIKNDPRWCDVCECLGCVC